MRSAGNQPAGDCRLEGHPGMPVKLLRQLASRHQAWLISRSTLAAWLLGPGGSWRPSARSFRLGKSTPHPSQIIRTCYPCCWTPIRQLGGDALPNPSGRPGQPRATRPGELPDRASPYFRPIQTTDKSRLLELLGDQRIDAVDLWTLAHPSMPPDHPGHRAPPWLHRRHPRPPGAAPAGPGADGGRAAALGGTPTGQAAAYRDRPSPP